MRTTESPADSADVVDAEDQARPHVRRRPPSTAVAVVHQEPATQGAGSHGRAVGAASGNGRPHARPEVTTGAVHRDRRPATTSPDPVVPAAPVVPSDEARHRGSRARAGSPRTSDDVRAAAGSPVSRRSGHNGGSGDRHEAAGPSRARPQWPVRDTRLLADERDRARTVNSERVTNGPGVGDTGGAAVTTTVTTPHASHGRGDRQATRLRLRPRLRQLRVDPELARRRRPR